MMENEVLDKLNKEAILDAKTCKRKIQAHYLMFIDFAASERLLRAKSKMHKDLGGSSYYKSHPRGDALDLVLGYIEHEHGFETIDSYVHVQHAAHHRAMHVVSVAAQTLHKPESTLGYGDLQELFDAGRNYLAMHTGDLALRIKSGKWEVEPL